MGFEPEDARMRLVHPRFSTGAAIVTALIGIWNTSSLAGVIGNWDFGAGSLAAAALVPGAQLTALTTTPYYGAYGGTPNPPALAFDTTAAFGLPTLGSYTGNVMRVPDMSGRGAAAGLMAQMPVISNGQLTGGGAATKLNRYSVVMDVLVPATSFDVAPTYIALFQPRASGDGSWFVREPSRNIGSTVAYSAVNSFLPDTWYRIAQVMELDAATSAPRCTYFINGSPVGSIIWDAIVVDDQRNADLKTRDLVPDGAWSIGTLADSAAVLPTNQSGFFLFNDQSNEYGELYVANVQFRDDALSSEAVLGLGGPAGGAIPVPEPGSCACLTSFVVWLACMRGLRQARDVGRMPEA